MKRCLLVVLLCALGTVWGRSQTVLTLEQCLAMARERSPRLRSAQNTVAATGFAQREIDATAYPQMSLQAAPFYAPYNEKFGYDPTSTDGGQISGQLVVQQSLYDGGVRGLRSEQMGIDLERAEQEYRMAASEVTLSVKQAFLEVLRSEAAARLEEESVAQLRDYAEVVKRLFNGGTASYTDVLKTDLQLSNSELARQKALDDHSAAKYALAELIGSAIDTSFSVAGSLEPLAPAYLDSLVSLSAGAAVASVDLSIADLQMRSGLLGVDITRHESWPALSLAGSAGYLSSITNLKLPPQDRLSAVGFGIGLTLDIPLITWGISDLKIQQREIAVSNLRLETERLQRSITSDMKIAGLRLRRSRERLQSIRLNLKHAEENYILTKSKFVGGGTLSLEVLAAQQLLTELRMTELQLLSDINLLAARLERLTTR